MVTHELSSWLMKGAVGCDWSRRRCEHHPKQVGRHACRDQRDPGLDVRRGANPGSATGGLLSPTLPRERHLVTKPRDRQPACPILSTTLGVQAILRDFLSAILGVHARPRDFLCRLPAPRAPTHRSSLATAHHPRLDAQLISHYRLPPRPDPQLISRYRMLVRLDAQLISRYRPPPQARPTAHLSQPPAPHVLRTAHL
jgi:hypothetical protein